MNGSNDLPDFSKKLVVVTVCGYRIKCHNLFKMSINEHLQTLFMTIFTFWFHATGFQIVPFILLFTNWAPRLRIAFIFYLCWVYYDRRTGFGDTRKWFWFKNLRIFRLYRDYFPIRLVKTSELTPDKNYLLAMYPHAILPMSVAANFGSFVNNVNTIFPNIDFAISTLNYSLRAPLIREYFLALGCLSSNESSMLHFLRSKLSRSLLVLPEGANAALISHEKGKYYIRIHHRGFVRIALKTGASLVPVFSFGENDTIQLISKFSGWMRYLSNGLYKLIRVRVIIFNGAGLLQQSIGLVPRRVPIITVVGKPIPVPKIENPPEDIVNEYLEKFFDSLRDLFEEHKHKYDLAGSSATLTYIFE